MNSLKKYGITQTSDQLEADSEIGGVSPKVFGTASNRKVLIKSGTSRNGKDCFAEYFAYKLGEAIGITVNEVSLIDCGDLLGFDERLCSVHVWEDDFITLYNWRSQSNKDLSEDDEIKLAVFDEIIYNEDRHDGNYGYLNGKLFCIDHGFAYPWRSGVVSRWPFKEYHEHDAVKDIIQNFMSITKEEFEEMVKLPEDLKHDLSPSYFTGTVSRMLEIQEMIRDIGEEETE